MDTLTFAGFAGACLIVVLLGFSMGPYGNSSKRKLTEMHKYLFPLVVRSAYIKRYPGLTEAQQEQVFGELRTYLEALLHEDQGGRKKLHGTPPAHVANAWAVFVQCTDQYEDFCNRFFGRVLPAQQIPSA